MKIEQIQRRRILVVGDLIVDTYHTGSVSRISPEAPIPVVRVKKSYSVLGGAANVARNLKTLHCHPIVVGIKGNDANGDLMEKLFNDSHIECHITPCQYPTITKTRIVGNRQQIVRVDFENEKMDISEDVYQQVYGNITSIVSQVDAIVLSDYGKGFCSDQLCCYVIKMANQNRIPIIVDPKGCDWYKYGKATFITPNVKELSDVAGEVIENKDESIIPVARKLLQRYKVENVLVTRSEQGMTLVNNNDVLNLPTVAREVYDVSGAGDTVVATLAASLSGRLSLKNALELSNQAAGIVVGKLGTQPVHYEELAISNTYLGDNKVVERNHLGDLLLMLKEKQSKIVFTNGCFDVIHMGHVTYLQEARKLGDLLIVGLNSDASVKRLKGESRPVNNEEARCKVLSSMSCVDYIVVFEEDTPLRLIEKVQPDILVKGGDYKKEDVVGREYAGEVVLIDFVEGYSSTKILEKTRH